MNSHIIKKNLYPLLNLAIPLVMTGMLQSAVFFCETLFIAHLGEQKLAAGALVSWLFGTMVVILFGTLGSINVLIAHKHGANDEAGIALVMRDGLLLALLLTIPTFLLFWNMAPIFLLTFILSFWGIALPLGYFFAHHCHFGGVGLWWGMVVGAVFSVLLLCWRFKSRCHSEYL